jgi:superfamily II DNA or RNA helicase
MIELRPFQKDVVVEIDRVIAEGKRRIVVVAPTGAGKTVIAAAIIEATTKHSKENAS